MVDIQRTKQLKIKDNEYKVSYPTVDQITDIESYKQIFSRGQYAEMATSNLKSQWDALELIEIRAYIIVLIPDLLKDLKVDSIGKLDAIDFIEIRDIFRKEFMPWYDAWYKLFLSKGEEEKK